MPPKNKCKRPFHLREISSPWGSWMWWGGGVPRSSSRPPSRGSCTGILTPPQSENGFAPVFQSTLILDALQIQIQKRGVFFRTIPKTHFCVLVFKLNWSPKSLPFSTIGGNQFSLNHRAQKWQLGTRTKKYPVQIQIQIPVDPPQEREEAQEEMGRGRWSKFSKTQIWILSGGSLQKIWSVTSLQNAKGKNEVFSSKTQLWILSVGSLQYDICNS